MRLHSPNNYSNSLQSIQAQDSQTLLDTSNLSQKLDEEAKAYAAEGNSRVEETSGDESSDEDDAASVDNEADSQNDTSPLFVGALMTLLGLEKIRQLIFKSGIEDERKRFEEEEMKKDTQRRLEIFDGLGNKRRAERATVAHHESNSNGEMTRDEKKRWVEEEGNVNRMLEALRRQRQERILENTGEGESREIIHTESVDFISTISQYIVLESNLVTCGAGLEIHRITPGYDLCQISLQLPIGTTGTEIVEMLLEQGLDSSDFHILRIEETEEWLEAIILTNIQFGNALECKRDAFMNHQVGYEVRRGALWTSGTMGPGSKPSLILRWDAESSSLSDTFHMELADVYYMLFELKGVRKESCCLLTPDTEPTINQVTLTVEFDNWENAMGAARDIRSKPWSIPSFEVKIPNARQQSIVIPLLQFEAQRRQWMELSDTGSEGGQIEIDILDDEVIIHVQGENNASVGSLKVRIEKLARGEVLEGDYWHHTFASSESSASFFDSVMESATVYLMCRSEALALVLYGEPDDIEEARRMIQEEVNLREHVLTKTALTGSSVSFFRNGGIQKLKDLVGEENAELKSTSRWSAIMMRGGERATHHLRRLIKESLVTKQLMNATTCPVCFEEQLYPEMLECGHGYCSGCLDLFLKAAADIRNFPITCVGQGATCKIPISLPFIHRFLPHYSFKHLLESAFAAYLEQNPTQFRYCKTPDCRQTYRQESADKAASITCPSCFVKTCSSCSEDHKTMTCAEYRISRDPEEQERLNEKLAEISGYKRCPRCAIWVEKTGGCNHMSCRCGVHICWICLGVFDPGEIYGHMDTCSGPNPRPIWHPLPIRQEPNFVFVD